jgi:NAD(P)-dependent dehydrogenase (short-subunit alcohol dehydrogenase family)
MNRRSVLVTGASSGIGSATVELLARAGYTVWAGSRSGDAPSRPDVHGVRVDVSDPASVQACVEGVVASSGSLDVVVHCAGVMLGALTEETDLATARKLFETNFWGVVQVNQQALPMMRRQGHGHVIIVGSLAGLVGTPGQAFYSAAKFALEGYAEALAAEILDFDIVVNVVEPGFHRTELHARMYRSPIRIEDYDAVRERVASVTKRSIEAGDDPRNVARTIERLVARRRFVLRHPVGRDARWVPRIKRVVPERMFRDVVRSKFGLVPGDDEPRRVQKE